MGYNEEYEVTDADLDNCMPPPDDDAGYAGLDDYDDEPSDHILAQQELEDFERADEYYGYYGDDGYYADY